jgi:hypothetical protein
VYCQERTLCLLYILLLDLHLGLFALQLIL